MEINKVKIKTPPKMPDVPKPITPVAPKGK